jgi:hypothetical protein
MGRYVRGDSCRDRAPHCYNPGGWSDKWLVDGSNDGVHSAGRSLWIVVNRRNHLGKHDECGYWRYLLRCLADDPLANIDGYDNNLCDDQGNNACHHSGNNACHHSGHDESDHNGHDDCRNNNGGDHRYDDDIWQPIRKQLDPRHF